MVQKLVLEDCPVAILNALSDSQVKTIPDSLRGHLPVRWKRLVLAMLTI